MEPDSSATAAAIARLPGREALLSELGSGWPPAALAVAVHIDICNFDILNLLCGARRNQRLLDEVAAALAAHAASDGRAAHLWSDEFVLVFGAASPAAALERVERLRAELGRLQLPAAAADLPFRASFGVVMAAPGGDA